MDQMEISTMCEEIKAETQAFGEAEEDMESMKSRGASLIKDSEYEYAHMHCFTNSVKQEEIIDFASNMQKIKVAF